MNTVNWSRFIQRVNSLRQFPLTLCLSTFAGALALLSVFFPILDWFCFDYTEIVLNGEYWRFITGHFVHSSFEHAFWDISLFALLCAYLEKCDPKSLMIGIGLAVTGLGTFILMPFAGIERYSGLSGIIYCLLVMAYWQWQKRQATLVALILALLVAGKTFLEWRADEALFVSEGWSVFVEAHLIGAFMGITALSCLKYKALLDRLVLRD